MSRFSIRLISVNSLHRFSFDNRCEVFSYALRSCTSFTTHTFIEVLTSSRETKFRATNYCLKIYMHIVEYFT